MIVLDLPLYHSMLALVALELAYMDEDSTDSKLDSMELNQAYLSFLKPSNIFQANSGMPPPSGDQSKKRPKGVLFGMFKSDCLALFGRCVLKIEEDALDRRLRAAYVKLLGKIRKHNMEDIYASDDPKQRTSQIKVQKLLVLQVEELISESENKYDHFIQACRQVFNLAYWEPVDTKRKLYLSFNDREKKSKSPSTKLNLNVV